MKRITIQDAIQLAVNAGITVHNASGEADAPRHCHMDASKVYSLVQATIDLAMSGTPPIDPHRLAQDAAVRAFRTVLQTPEIGYDQAISRISSDIALAMEVYRRGKA